MKFYRARPAKELRIVKPDSGDGHYEFWVLQPVYIGSARKIGTQHIEAEDGTRFINLNNAAMHFASQGGHIDVAPPPAVVRNKVSGLDLLERGKWLEFCRLRNLNARSTECMQKEYVLSPKELEDLSLR